MRCRSRSLADVGLSARRGLGGATSFYTKGRPHFYKNRSSVLLAMRIRRPTRLN
ncbi:MAG: hypothetical protein KF688_02340 [Pirellulales bacterium]|nr:hypothetical protein [Pirellulales bacterium]